MTTEEKAKAYDEALERARKELKQDLHESGVWAIQRIFPELRESEDERIRKELKEAFEAYDIESKWNGIPIRSIFAWLEKQKKQMPLPEDTLIFRKGVEEGKRLMMEDAVEADVNTYRNLEEGTSWAEFVVEMPTNNLGDKVRIIILPKEDGE